MDRPGDPHVDAMHLVRESLPALAGVRDDRRGRVDTDEVDRYNARRRELLARLGAGAGGVAATSVLGGAFGTVLAATLAVPARADTALDVQILQTASSIERLAVDTYDGILTAGTGPNAALGRIPAGSAHDTMVTFVTTTRKQHADHLHAFQAQTVALGGAAQDAPNPRFTQVLGQQVPGLGDPQKLVDFAAALEKLATDTYLLNLTMLDDRRTKEILAGVMAVEAQHLATLRAVAALLGSPQLVAVPFPQGEISHLPAAVCSRAFPDALHQLSGPDGVAEPASGAVK